MYFDLLLNESTFIIKSEFNKDKKLPSYILQIIVSYFVYYGTSVYFLNNLMAVNATGLNDFLNSSAAPFVFGFVFFFIANLISNIYCIGSKDNKFKKMLKPLLLGLFIGLILACIFKIVVDTRNNQVNNDDGRNGEGIQWPDYGTSEEYSEKNESTPVIPSLQIETRTNQSKIFPIFFCIICGFGLFLWAIAYQATKKEIIIRNKPTGKGTGNGTGTGTGNGNGTGNGTGNGKVTGKGTGNGNAQGGSNANTINVLSQERENTSNKRNNSNNSSNTNCETSGSKAKGGIIFATLTLMIYIATIAINIFLTFVAPAAYLILMTLQRLLITNLFLEIEDDSWERDWNLILIPIIDYVVFNWFKGNEMFKGQSPEDYSITGRKNRDIFGKINFKPIFKNNSVNNTSTTKLNNNKIRKLNTILKTWFRKDANLDESSITQATKNLSNLQGGSNGSNATLDIYKYFKEFLTTIIKNRIERGSPLKDYESLIKKLEKIQQKIIKIKNLTNKDNNRFKLLESILNKYIRELYRNKPRR